MANLKYVVTVNAHYANITDDGPKVVGVFTDEIKARTALDNVFHKFCDKLGIAELNAFSSQSGSYFELQADNSNNPEYQVSGEVHLIPEEDFEYDIFDDDDETHGHFRQVESLAQLLGQIDYNIDNNGGEPVEVAVALNYGCYSRKSITYADELDENGSYKLEVYNHIDDTTQILTLDELFDESKTYIGKAINCGALYFDE